MNASQHLRLHNQFPEARATNREILEEILETAPVSRTYVVTQPIAFSWGTVPKGAHIIGRLGLLLNHAVVSFRYSGHGLLAGLQHFNSGE